MSTFREMSIEGCPEIGRGAHGIVYRTAPDMLVKVYYAHVSLDSIRRERELARWAFVKGIPTTIPFDIVRIGESYGTVFEHLNAESPSDYIKRSPEHFEDFLNRAVDLMRKVHAIEATPGELPDMKQKHLDWMPKIRQLFPSELYSKLSRIVEAVPECHTILHGDFHMNNILICGDELMLIDMDTLCTGDPIFELATVFVSYRQFPSIEPKAAHLLGIDVDTAARICDRMFRLYLVDADEETIREVTGRAQILGCIRVIDYMDRHPELPDQKKVIRRCVEDMTARLNEIP